jgi:hypothetical protein
MLQFYQSCVFNFLYGTLIDNNQVMIVNVVGFNLEAIYILFFLYYTLNKVFNSSSIIWKYIQDNWYKVK